MVLRGFYAQRKAQPKSWGCDVRSASVALKLAPRNVENEVGAPSILESYLRPFCKFGLANQPEAVGFAFAINGWPQQRRSLRHAGAFP